MDDLLIVDGDNVAHRLTASTPERRRDDLLTGVSSYAENAGVDVIVVFDGHGRDRAIGRVSVRHAEAETADSVIERLLASVSRLQDELEILELSLDLLGWLQCGGGPSGHAYPRVDGISRDVQSE